jgi:hypothetical protein
VEGYILRRRLEQLGHHRLSEPDGLAIQPHLQLQAAILVDEQFPLSGWDSVALASKRKPPAAGKIAGK